MPIRGHSGVQGGAEMGAYSTVLPGGTPITPESARHFADLWGFPVSDRTGLTTVDALDASARGDLQGLYCIGGNFLETMPAPHHIRAGLATIPLRIHSDIVMSSQMLVEPADTVYLLPARTRYEQRDGGTETTTERRVIFAPHRRPRGRRGALGVGDAPRLRPRGEARGLGRDPLRLRSRDPPRDRRSGPRVSRHREAREEGRQFQWGGPHLCAVAASPPQTARRTSSRGRRRRARASPRPATSVSPPGAASSSTRWCSRTSTRSAGGRATPC